MRKEHETNIKTLIDNNTKTIQQLRSQYERETEHLKEQLEEAYSDLNSLKKDAEKLASTGPRNRGSKEQLPQITSRGTQTTEDSLEKNFLKLKELYDTLYKANLSIMKDHKELQEKYTKVLKSYHKSSKDALTSNTLESKTPAKKPSIKVKDSPSDIGRSNV